MTQLLGFAEPVSSWLHLFGLAVAIALAPRLVRLGADAGSRAALSVFVFGALFLLSMSGVYHLLDGGTGERAVLRRLDHAAIWVLIAGTFTPVHAMLFSGVSRWGVLAFIWAGALAGIVLKTVFFASFPESVGLALYLGFGWIGAASIFALARRHGRAFVMPLLWGGVAYSAGGVIDYLEAPTIVPGYVGAHELFHLAVLLGLLAHWRFIERVVMRAGVLDRRRVAAAGLKMSATS